MSLRQSTMLGSVLPMQTETVPEAEPVTDLRLHSLKLRNFKGFEELTLSLDGRGMDIYADNGLGKTTIEDSYLWLLTGKDSLNKQDLGFGLKPLKNGEPVHNLETEVEGRFLLNGKMVTLRRVFAEEWTKRRNQPKAELTGHKTSYFIDIVSKTQRQYEDYVGSIIGEKVFRLLSDPRYFNEQVEWKERRKIILDVCGDVPDSDVITCDSRLAGLTEILGSRSLDDHLEVIRAAKAKVNKDMEQIPIRISEVQRGLPSISGLAGNDPKTLAEELAKDVETAKAARKAKMEELTRAEAGGGVADKQKRLSEVSSRILDLEVTSRRKVEEVLYQKRAQLQDARSAVTTTERDIERLNSDAAGKQEESARQGERLQQFRDQWCEVDAQEFVHTDERVCPTCGQNLPAEMIQETREKVLADFNLSKSERLEKITAEGKTAKQQEDRLDSEAIRARNEVILAQKRLNEAKASVVKFQGECDKTEAQRSNVSQTPEYTKLATERDTLTDAIASLKAGSEADLAGIRAEIGTLDQAVSALERSALQVEQRMSGETRITELQEQERQLSAEFERLEKELWLCEEFMKDKVRLLDDKIAPRFQVARFRMLEHQVNGAWIPCCETLGADGVPYSKGLCNSGKINTGLDIIRTLSRHYSCRVPIFIDNAEAVVRLTPMDAQVVRLVVSEADTVLRVEKEVV